MAVGRRPKVLIYGSDYPTRDGTCVRDYVHTADLAQAHQLAVESLEPGMGRAYNLGSGTGVTVLEVLRACEEAIGRPISHEIVGRRPGDPGRADRQPGEDHPRTGLVAPLLRHPRDRPDRLELASPPSPTVTGRTVACIPETDHGMSLPICSTGIPCPARRRCGARSLALEELGLTLHRFSLRRYDGDLVDDERPGRAGTDPSRARRRRRAGWLRGVLGVIATRPTGLRQSLAAGRGVGRVDERGLLRTLIYLGRSLRPAPVAKPSWASTMFIPITGPTRRPSPCSAG